jgi:hypothetical protein
MLFVAGSYQNGAMGNQLTDIGKGKSVLGVIVNLFTCGREGALYSVHVHSLIVSLHKSVTP